jgi:hypothetical protein
MRRIPSLALFASSFTIAAPASARAGVFDARRAMFNLAPPRVGRFRKIVNVES